MPKAVAHPPVPPRLLPTRAAAIYTLIETAKMNDVDPRAWLADVLSWLADHPMSRVDELLPWNWKPARHPKAIAA